MYDTCFFFFKSLATSFPSSFTASSMLPTLRKLKWTSQARSSATSTLLPACTPRMPSILSLRLHYPFSRLTPPSPRALSVSAPSRTQGHQHAFLLLHRFPTLLLWVIILWIILISMKTCSYFFYLKTLPFLFDLSPAAFLNSKTPQKSYLYSSGSGPCFPVLSNSQSCSFISYFFLLSLIVKTGLPATSIYLLTCSVL